MVKVADDLGSQLQSFLHEAKKLVPTTAKRQMMTAAGGKVLAGNLQDEIRSKHFQAGRDTSKVKHLADSVTSVNSDMDGVVNGNTIVGYEGVNESGVNHGRIARFLNDGTKKMAGDNFHNDTVRNSETAVFKAMAEVYEHGGEV